MGQILSQALSRAMTAQGFVKYPRELPPLFSQQGDIPDIENRALVDTVQRERPSRRASLIGITRISARYLPSARQGNRRDPSWIAEHF
jgi:hypothetical protein